MTIEYKTYTSARDTGERIVQRTIVGSTSSVQEDKPAVVLDDRITYQTIEGFGGAFTEAAADTLYKLPVKVQDEILNAYFDQASGHGYTLCRTHINSCDFSLGNYAYTEIDGDVDLEHFSIARDHNVLIPMIKRAMGLAGPDLRIFASPWSPPAWMKTNGQMNRGGKLKAEYRDAWARYYVRYIQEYRRIGIDIWGLTIQNEPEATQSWDSCIYTGEEERVFLRDFLGPALQDTGLEDVKVIIWDHNRDELFLRAKAVLDDPEAAKYVWGVGFHWYVADKFENISLVRDAYPGKVLLLTEACVERGPHSGDWSPGELYGRSIIQDLNHGAAAWVDWNMLLNQEGGPNHVGNYCSAPIIADTDTGEVFYQSSYYYLGHFSRFIKPGSKRILCSTNRDALEATAVTTDDGSVVVVALNRTEMPMDFLLKHKESTAIVPLPAHGIVTVRSGG